jgi:transglutaminase-like putative cysteine protease
MTFYPNEHNPVIINRAMGMLTKLQHRSLITKTAFVLVSIIVLFSTVEGASLAGVMENTVSVQHKVSFDLNKGKIDDFTYTFPIPSDYKYRSISQKISGMKIHVNPNPARIETKKDKNRNVFKVIHWKSVSGEIGVTLEFKAHVSSKATELKSRAPHPVKISRRFRMYLEPSKYTDDTKGELNALARKLTRNSKTEMEAVRSILGWVNANIDYRPTTPRASAINTLSRKYGNCEGYSNLTVALLRNAGIPARVAGGISLSRKWKTPTERGYRIYDMGQGPHAWVEVYFPDIGWVPYDPQSKELMFSSRLIKFAQGPDTKAINNSWSSDSYLPKYIEKTDAVFIKDSVDVKLK